MPNRLEDLIKALGLVEHEFNFQQRRLQEMSGARNDPRLKKLAEEYAEAAKSCHRLRTHQQRRLNLLETGDARG